jgi:hypothetical protein
MPGCRRVLAEAECVQQFVDDRDMRLTGVVRQQTLEFAGAQIDDPAVASREREHARPGARALLFAVDEHNRCQIALRRDSELMQALSERPSVAIPKLGENRLAACAFKPFRGALEDVRNGSAKVPIPDVETKRRGVTYLCRHRSGQQANVEDAEQYHRCSPKPTRSHGRYGAASRSLSLEIRPEILLKSSDVVTGCATRVV